MHPSEIVFQPLSRGTAMPIIGGSIRAISNRLRLVYDRVPGSGVGRAEG